MIGHSLEDQALKLAQAKGITFGQALQWLGGKPTQAGLVTELGSYVPKGVSERFAGKALGKFGSKVASGAARVAPALSVAGNVMDVADIITGDESFANKAMDTAAMGTGAAIGGLMGAGVFSPLTASIGAGIGKMGSDGLQWLFGDKKTPEQRKLEEALIALRGGVV